MWLQCGWHVAVAYANRFLVLLLAMGWEPGEKRGSLPVS